MRSSKILWQALRWLLICPWTPPVFFQLRYVCTVVCVDFEVSVDSEVWTNVDALQAFMSPLRGLLSKSRAQMLLYELGNLPQATKNRTEAGAEIFLRNMPAQFEIPKSYCQCFLNSPWTTTKKIVVGWIILYQFLKGFAWQQHAGKGKQ